MQCSEILVQKYLNIQIIFDSENWHELNAISILGGKYSNIRSYTGLVDLLLICLPSSRLKKKGIREGFKKNKKNCIKLHIYFWLTHPPPNYVKKNMLFFGLFRSFEPKKGFWSFFTLKISQPLPFVDWFWLLKVMGVA